MSKKEKLKKLLKKSLIATGRGFAKFVSPRGNEAEVMAMAVGFGTHNAMPSYAKFKVKEKLAKKKNKFLAQKVLQRADKVAKPYIRPSNQELDLMEMISKY